jgi:hypothetical protein
MIFIFLGSWIVISKLILGISWPNKFEAGPHAVGGLRIADPRCIVLDIVQIWKFRYGIYNIFIEYVTQVGV